MEIRLNDRFAIRSDARNYCLATVSKRKKTGEEYYKDFAFFTNLETLLKYCAEFDIRDDELKDIREIHQRINELKADITRVAGSLPKVCETLQRQRERMF